MTSQTGPFIQTQVPEGFYNLAMGQPSPRLLPMELLASAAARRLRPDADRLLLQYAVCPGGEPFRRSLSRFLSHEHQADIPPGSLMISNGISGALALLFGVFGSNRLVVSEDPTYFLAREVFVSSGAEIVGVPVDEDGLVVEALERRLVEGLRPSVVYTIPTFHNPTSACLSEARRRRLLDLAESYDFIVLADEPYNLLWFGAGAPAPLALLDEGRGRVVSAGSFSKLFGPGLRLGWLHAAPALIDRIVKHGVLSSGGGLNPIIAEIVQETLDDGSLSAHIGTLRQTLGQRRTALVKELRAQLPALQFATPQGGYFLWAKLPERLSAPELWAIAQRHSVSFMPGTRCSIQAGHQDHIRLSFSFYDCEEIPEGVRRLAASIKEAQG